MEGAMRPLWIIAVLAAVSLPALAEDPQESKLEGTVYLDAETCAKDGRGADCVLSFSVEGEAAKLLYNGMKGKARREESTGGMEKMDGKGLHCIMGEDKSYSCDFGYHFGKKAFAGSAMDC
jgi:hypothetical protein